ncbi:lipoprotein [Siminovitchia terrae]|uniref:Lipoprotein n=1 Tax=Siminovitchia terrae TaxID=1914933 RepID=A0ABQ4KSB3_SIMTE|nr:DUF5052 family protein [Siminovitchia terrae]GIN94924.1 lipoprotein [Siminovitchia terrae]
MKSNSFRISLIITAILGLLFLSGCNFFSNEVGKMKEALKGREVVIQTYDEDSNIIDRIQGKSVSIGADKKFDLTDSEGKTVEKSSVIGFTVGGESVVHVGSSLIMYETGLENVFEEYSKKVDIENIDRSVPFVNRLVNDMKNITTGKSKVILIRSQSGKPLATFVGDKVSYFATDIDKSTGILIDGQYLFIYRCDYTIYDASLLN